MEAPALGLRPTGRLQRRIHNAVDFAEKPRVDDLVEADVYHELVRCSSRTRRGSQKHSTVAGDAGDDLALQMEAALREDAATGEIHQLPRRVAHQPAPSVDRFNRIGSPSRK